MKKDKLQVLIVGDSPEDRAVMRRLLLVGRGRNDQIIEAESGADGLRACLENEAGPPDCVLLDYFLPDYDAIDFLSALGGPDLTCCPIVVVTGFSSDIEDARLLRQGAQDVIGKHWMNPQSLARSVEHAIDRFGIVRSLCEKERLLSESQRIAHIGSWVYRFNGQFSWSEEAYRLFGVSQDKFTPDIESFIDLIYSEDRLAMRSWIAVRQRGGHPGDLEFRRVQLDGSVRYLRVQGELIHDFVGTALYMTGTVQDITEQKYNEQALRESESRFLMMANAAPVLIWVSGEGKRCKWVNRAWLNFTGHSLEEEQGNGWTKSVHPDDLNRVLEIYVMHFDWREGFQVDFRLRRHDGEYRWLTGQGVPLLDEQGSFTGYISSFTDVTPSKELTIKLRKTLKDLSTQTTRLQTILETASDGIYILDIQGNIVQFSDSFTHMLGYTHEEMARLNVADLDAQIPKSQLLEKIAKLMKQQAQFETQHRRKDGSIIDVEINAKGVKLEGVYYLYNSARDITERKRLEEKLAASTREVEDLYDNAPCAYHSIGPDGTYLRVNATELSWLGCRREEVVGKMKPSDFFTPEGKMKFAETFAQLINEGHAENVEYQLVGKNGNTKHVSFRGTAIKDDGGNFLRTRSLFFDITELKKTRDQLEQLTQEQRAMLDNELVGIVRLRDRSAIWKNKAMDRIFGYGPGELDGQSSRIFFPDDASYEKNGEIAYSMLNAYGSYRTQIEMVRKDGKKIWVDISGAKLSGADNESLWVMADITQTKQYQEKIEHIAFHDHLTGLPNRLLVADRLILAQAQAERSGRLLAVCCLDLDGFKPVNDNFGHAAGDQLLIELARRLLICIRSTDTVGRLGGDEFVLLLGNLENFGECQVVLQRVIEAVKQPVALDTSSDAMVTASIGIAMFPVDATDPDTLLRYADQALYSAKQNGRNQYQFFDLNVEWMRDFYADRLLP